MKAYSTFRRHPFGEVVPRTNEDRRPWDVVPYGKFGAGVWTGHPAGLGKFAPCVEPALRRQTSR
jgi:hypothetical protein